MTRVLTQIAVLTIFCSNAFSTGVISGKISNCQLHEIKPEYSGGYYFMPANYYLSALRRLGSRTSDFRWIRHASKTQPLTRQ